MRFWKVFRRNFLAWRKLGWGILFNALDPILFIFAFGFGIGYLVGNVNGMRYIDFISPAMLSIASLYGAFFETTYNAFVRMYYEKLYIAYISTKLSMRDVVLGELFWATFRGFVYSLMVFAVLLFFNALKLSDIFWVLPLSVLSSFMFSSIGYTFTSIVRSIIVFDYIYFVFISPMMLFSETYFPLDVLPEAFQVVVPIVSPLYHSVNLLRSILFEGNFAIGSFLYILLMIVVFSSLSIFLMERRIIR